MAKVAIICGLLLIGLGVVGYMGHEPAQASADGVAVAEGTDSAAESSSEGDAEDKPAKKSVTALIPAFVGILLAFFGALALKESMRMHAMHGAATVGLLGALAGAGRGAMGLGKFFSGDPSLNQRSFLFVWLMALICGVFVFLCIQSFIAARKQREAEQAS
ncbi:MAG: hypothetical protein VXZ82_14110 [Planctomycetota bacterium]|nr:hypothetical protein [Planctomycetota bacterium]